METQVSIFKQLHFLLSLKHFLPSHKVSDQRSLSLTLLSGDIAAAGSWLGPSSDVIGGRWDTENIAQQTFSTKHYPVHWTQNIALQNIILCTMYCVLYTRTLHEMCGPNQSRRPVTRLCSLLVLIKMAQDGFGPRDWQFYTFSNLQTPPPASQ